MHIIGSWSLASSRGPSRLNLRATLPIGAIGTALFLSLTLPDARLADARPLAASDIVFDTGPASDLLATWPKAGTGTIEAPRSLIASERLAAVELSQTPAYLALRAFIADDNRCRLTDEEFARVVTHPDSTLCGLSLQPAYADRDSIRALVAEIQSRGDSLATRIAAEVGRYVPSDSEWHPVRFWFVLSSRWSFDALTLSAEQAGADGPIVLINLTQVIEYGATTKERLDTLAHVMAHEAFHSALRQREPALDGWAKYPLSARFPLSYIARIMADEGVAHWIDWQARPGADSIFTARPGAKETKAFDVLAKALDRVRERGGDPTRRMEALQAASNGPLWSKYGSISGMFASFRIESRLGLDSLRAAVAAGPNEFLKMYGRVAAADTLLKRVPAALSEGR